ncbi:hypothetical protein IKQ19_18200 [Candidatus Saccharibacteria bacterium]|nr:hypothetical protein [Candidatus Saccharibacteria bacterium]
MKFKTLISILLISLFYVSCGDNSKESNISLVNKKSNYSDEFVELVQRYGQYSVVLAIINISMRLNENSEFVRIIEDWDYADYKENILKTIDSSESFNQAIRNQVETLKRKRSLQNIIECWLEIYNFINHLRKLNFDMSFEEFLYSISEMKPIMDEFFQENDIQEWSSMSYSQMYLLDYYLCNYLASIPEYESMKLLSVLTKSSVDHLE